jgi:eukaryotic-like serine/threonine-protein kinase
MSVDAAAEEQFGPYLVYERLGVGGMATVHRALEQGAEGFERMVALKRLLPHLAEDASFIKSFVREAKLASILNHVNIVQIYELGRVGTEYFISMEYIDGRDLRRILRHARKVTGPPPIHITVGIMIQLCDALDYAHHKTDEDGHPLGLVHRDISPSNLLVTSGGHLKIIDFGIAKAQSSQLRTQTGRVKGKLAYMAPEAVSGSRDLDSRSDIWACGVILHELLTARPLFASKNEYQTLLKVQRGDIMPASTFNHACPPELDAIVSHALARDADERYATAGELREALVALKRQHALQTGYRDIAGWLDWAFGLEAPASFSNNPDSSGVASAETPRGVRHKTARPARNTEEDEAVEVVWGSGARESDIGPVVLEDVPDVSGKHKRPKRDTENDSDNEIDDIPTPPPSHGTMPSIYGSEHAARKSDQLRSPRAPTSGPHTVPRPGSGPIPKPGSGPIPKPASGATPRPGRSTSPGVGTTSKKQSGPFPKIDSKSGPVPTLDTPQFGDRMAAQRARESEAPENRARSRNDSDGYTNPESQRLRTEPDGMSPEDLFGVAAAEALAHVSEQMDSASTDNGLPQQDDEPTLEPSTPANGLPNVPVVRFSRTAPPPVGRSPLTDSTRPPPSTKPGIAPVRAVTAAAPHTPRAKAPTQFRIGDSIAARAKPKRTGLLVLGALLLSGGAATAVVVLMQNRHSTTRDAEHKPTTPAARDVGTVKFMLEPTDAEIRIAGQVVHAGSPWSSELAAGTHQIEIHRSGYKSWLTSLDLSANETQTLRVVLEPLTEKTGEAALTITTTPSGLEVLIDGRVQPQRTPFKGKLDPGAHKIAVRQNGIEVWQQNLSAEASSNYEFNPSFTADKQRDRAQRAPTRSAPPIAPSLAPAAAPAAKPEVRGDRQDPPPTWTKPSPTTSPTPSATPAVVAPSEKPPATAITPPSTTPPPTTPAPKPVPPAPKQAIAQPVTPTPAPAAPPKRSGPPPIVPPNAVKKVSGEPPSIEKFKNVELPAMLAAKICIDHTGRVTSADMMTKVTTRVANDLTASLRTWRYAPYMLKGAASPACFVVTFRAK